jgi:hypothetical protein
MLSSGSIFFEIYERSLSTATFCIFSLLILFAGCGGPSDKHLIVSSADSDDAKQEALFVVEVRWISLEGGFYGLVAEDGRRYLPVNLPEEYKKDGLKIRVRGKIKTDVATIYMWGTPLEIMEIEVLD